MSGNNQSRREMLEKTGLSIIFVAMACESGGITSALSSKGPELPKGQILPYPEKHEQDDFKHLFPDIDNASYDKGIWFPFLLEIPESEAKYNKVYTIKFVDSYLNSYIEEYLNPTREQIDDPEWMEEKREFVLDDVILNPNYFKQGAFQNNNYEAQIKDIVRSSQLEVKHEKTQAGDSLIIGFKIFDPGKEEYITINNRLHQGKKVQNFNFGRFETFRNFDMTSDIFYLGKGKRNDQNYHKIFLILNASAR